MATVYRKVHHLTKHFVILGAPAHTSATLGVSQGLPKPYRRQDLPNLGDESSPPPSSPLLGASLGLASLVSNLFWGKLTNFVYL